MFISAMHRHIRAFTLIELLAVVAIMGIFAFAVVPEILDFIDRTQRRRIESDLVTLSGAIQRYMGDRRGTATGEIHPPLDIVGYSALIPNYPSASYSIAEALYDFGYLTDILLDPWGNPYSISITAPYSIEFPMDSGNKLYHGAYRIKLQSMGPEGGSSAASFSLTHMGRIQ